MIELRFHKEIYLGTCVDEAVKVYQRFGKFDLVDQNTHWSVKVTAKNPAREASIAKELGNYALGLSIKNAGQGK